ncbi:hypothetical protein [Rhodoluna sp.]|uniref:hypothetical protein n=1 Tax=Rhodoluna sp. TaxID=1969481 RepID=UPI0025FC0A61|nr:hypothetical protein [Rhodoluna sp.]
MVYRINPSHQALWRDPHTLQLGLGSNKVLLRKLSAAQERLVAALYQGIADQQLGLVSNQLGLAESESKSLIADLEELLLQESPKPNSKLQLSADFISSAYSEIIKSSLLHSVDGEAVLLERQHRRVQIENLEKTGLSLSLGLAAAGVGQLCTIDNQKVQSADLGPSGYPSQLAGRTRGDALHAILDASPNQTKISHETTEKQVAKLDFAVLIANQALPTKRYEQLMKHSVPHLAITFDSQGAWVSPTIVPGKTACLKCLDLSKTEADEKWPALASQLATSTKRFDDTASQLFAAGLALQKTLTQLDRVGGFELTQEETTGYRLANSTGEVSEFQWPANKACDCF